MNKSIKWVAGIVVIVIIAFFCFRSCPRHEKEEPKVNVVKVHDYSDSVVKVVQDLILARDSIRTQQEFIRIQAGIIASKTKQVARIKDLRAKAGWTYIGDTGSHGTKNHHTDSLWAKWIDSIGVGTYYKKSIDSIIEVAEIKEALLDSANNLLGKTFKSIDQSDSLGNVKDSLTHGLIVKLNEEIDALTEENKKNKKGAYWRGLKHGFMIGGITGLVGGVALTK